MIYSIIQKKTKRILLVAFLIFLAIALKLGYSELVSYEMLKEKANDLWQRSFPIEGDRGEITDSTGEVLATNLTTASLVVVPSQIDDPVSAASAVADILGCDEKELYHNIHIGKT